MKLDQLREVIREEVRSAVKQELKDIIVEAVEIASRPEKNVSKETVNQEPTQQNQPRLNRQELAEMIGLKTPPKQTNIQFSSDKNIQELLSHTHRSMSGEDYRNVVNATSGMVTKPNFSSTVASQMGMSGNYPGLDISSLGFVQKAKQVYDKAVEKSQNKL